MDTELTLSLALHISLIDWNFLLKAWYNDKEYVITQPIDDHMSFSAVREVLIAEWKLLAQCAGIKEEFNQLIRDAGIKVPSMFLQSGVNLVTWTNFFQLSILTLKIHSMEKLSPSRPQAAAPCPILDSLWRHCSLVGITTTQFVSSQEVTILALWTMTWPKQYTLLFTLHGYTHENSSFFATCHLRHDTD